ncbi:DUF1540 domain-containing protein [Calderihabitans maritimus]|uniref:DUF1540 domain-containing protein n=1 Tax=Calderihabitans maritimus TaxID=1246530 RepID=A0A1Z5HTM6_9FIRM|nr:DUF1540 domain-containing protein [Calderihabitans maritimus]GAW92896.1 hypothetical protein Mahau_1668 [Calderihabitans maritimus]
MVGRVSRTNEPIGRVKCVVNTCHYWDNGDVCKASSIEIQPPGARDTETTDCATFAPKEM